MESEPSLTLRLLLLLRRVVKEGDADEDVDDGSDARADLDDELLLARESAGEDDKSPGEDDTERVLLPLPSLVPLLLRDRGGACAARKAASVSLSLLTSSSTG